MKYKAEPLIATGLYYSLFSLISLDFTSASVNEAATSLALVLVLFSTSINSVSSKRLPVEVVSLCNKLASNFCKSFLFWLTSANN